MKYYKVTQETNSEIIGRYPQLKGLKISFNEARASQWGKISQWKSEDDIPDLNNFLLQTKSKLTDNLSSEFVIMASGLFLSEKGRLVFEKFKFNGDFYSASVFYGEDRYEYNFLWYETGGTSNIEWKETIFSEYSPIMKTYGKQFSVDSFEEYKLRLNDFLEENEDWKFVPKLIVFKENFDITPAFGVGLICNEKVKNTIEENHLTGCLFEPVDAEISFR
ncbi:hypothetical protein ACFQO9_17275 [Chryseobacterium zhengzhouense]|uniref:Uncharacterized protein n=1 Tax=Chryseobacterium zhengzhouense TaxID=1636086 RepID=A0ABW2M303_9FLAO